MKWNEQKKRKEREIIGIDRETLKKGNKERREK
jgi:hypothetical protein